MKLRSTRVVNLVINSKRVTIRPHHKFELPDELAKEVLQKNAGTIKKVK